MVSDLERLRELAGPVLASAPSAGPDTALPILPLVDDYARVFHPGLAPVAQKHYEAIWAGKPTIVAKPGQTVVRLWIADAGELLGNTGEAPGFPRGYGDIAPHLQPGFPWIAWKYLKPGTNLGMAYDGLVWLGDRFAWFPKPWRVLQAKNPPPGVWSE
jgi:hypothetical protein